MAFQYGYLFDWDLPRGLAERDVQSHLKKAIDARKDFHHISGGASASHPRWMAFWFDSKKSLMGEDGGFLEQGPFRYRILLRVNEKTGTLIIAAARYTITDAVIREFANFIRPIPKRRQIDVERTTKTLFQTLEKKFLVTYLHADVTEYGTELRTISLHGDDLGGVDFLEKKVPSFVPRQVGVRPINNKKECGRFSNNGGIQFLEENTPLLERFLSYSYELEHNSS